MNKNRTQLITLLAFMGLTVMFVLETQANDKAQSNLLTGLFCDDPRLGMAIIKQETNFNNVISKEGSIGLMQVREGTAKAIKCEGTTTKALMIPLLNVKCGCKLLNLLSKKYKKRTEVIASYNAGSPRICRTGTLFPSGTKCSKGSLINLYYVERVAANYRGSI